MILVTDGSRSILIFFYGDTQWGSNYPNETYQLEFGGLDSYFRTNEGSIQNITKLSNVGVPGLFMFRVDRLHVINPTSNVSGK